MEPANVEEFDERENEDISSTATLSIEILNTTVKSTLSFPCDICDYSAKTVTTLKRHKQSRHKMVRYPCDQCEFSATVGPTLKKHKEAIHEGIR